MILQNGVFHASILAVFSVQYPLFVWTLVLLSLLSLKMWNIHGGSPAFIISTFQFLSCIPIHCARLDHQDTFRAQLR